MKSISLKHFVNNHSANNLAIVTPNVCLNYRELQRLNWKGFHRSSVIICCKYEHNIVKAVVALDGTAKNFVILPPVLKDNEFTSILRLQKFDLVLTDSVVPKIFEKFSISVVEMRDLLHQSDGKSINESVETSWLVATSGTTATPKLITHTLRSLTKVSLKQTKHNDKCQVWGLFYDVSRFAGLQVLLNCLLQGHTLVLSATYQSFSDRVEFAAENSVSHISATPTLWRKLLMCEEASKLALEQITLGGEGADQAILRKLNLRFPNARITHVYAATEVGVCFSVSDMKAGYPVSYLRDKNRGVTAKIVNNKLLVHRVEDPKLVKTLVPLTDGNEWIDTGDIASIRGDRFYVLGRETGMINVGGEKVIPEVVRGVLLELDFISDVLVYGKGNSISGQLVAADVALKTVMNDDEARKLIDFHSRQYLTSPQRPRFLRFVDLIKVNSTGKAVKD